MSLMHCNFSDHDFVYLALKKTPIKREKISFQYRNTKNLNIAALKHFFDSYDWADYYNCSDTETCWNLLLQIFIYGIDLHAPLISMNNVLKREEWMNNSALSAIHKRDKLRDILASYPSIDKSSNSDAIAENTKNKVKLRLEFNNARNKARQLVNKARYSYVQEKLNTTKSSPKKFWKELKMYMPGKKDKGTSNSSRITLIDGNGILLENDIDSANHINSYFTNIGPDLSSQIHSDNSKYLKDFEEVFFESYWH